MSAEGLAYVFKHSPYTGAALMIHVCLGDIANDLHANELWLRASELAGKARTTRENVTRLLPQMVRDGFLARLSPEGNLGKPVRYRFLMPTRPVTWRHTPPVTTDHTTSDDRSHLPVTTDHTELKKNSSELKTSSLGDRLCLVLADLVEGNGSKRPNVTNRWRSEAEKMLRIDGRDPSEAERLIRWCQADGFWRSNILSMPTFRVKYDQLRLRSQNGNGTRPDPPRPLTDGEAYAKIKEAFPDD